MDKDIYFLKIAKIVAKQSKCLSRKVGAIITINDCIVSTGYNGAPSKIPHCNERTLNFYLKLDGQLTVIDGDRFIKTCPRKMLKYGSGDGLHLCQAAHAERNAIVQASKVGVSIYGGTLYAYCGLPCKDCIIEIINSGIKRIVCLDVEFYDEYSKTLIKDSKIQIKKIPKSYV